MRRPLVSALLSALFFVVGCGAGAKSVDRPPSAGAQAWLDAERANDPRAAYDLLAEARSRDQKKVDYDVFLERWKSYTAERKRQTQALVDALGRGTQRGERATVTLGDGDTTELVHEPGGWRLDAPLLSSASAASPEEALRQLADAVEARNYDGVLRILTSSRRDGLRDVARAFVEGLRAHAKEAEMQQGDTATLYWNDSKGRWRIKLKKEDGNNWRIDDINH